MPQAPKPLDPSLSTRHRFGAELRRWRELRGLSQAALARLVHVSPDLIAKIEKADRRPTQSLANACDRLLSADGSLASIWPEIERELRGQLIASPIDPELATHWSRMLAVLAAADNAMGVRGLQNIVSEELRLLARHRRAAAGQLGQRFGQIQARWLEFASWIADNDGDPVQAATCLSRADQLAVETDAPTVAGYVLMRRAQRAVEAFDPRTAIALAEPAARHNKLPPRIKALSLVRAAQAHALEGNPPAVQARMTLAYRAVEKSGTDPEDEALAGHCTTAYIRAHEAHCRLLLGEPMPAIRAYHDVLADWPIGQRLDEGLFRAQLAVAHDAAGMTEEADAEGLHALDLARQTGSQRTMSSLRLLVARRAGASPRAASRFLHAWQDEPR
jgi:transcriptional regulator with XRE-family HTH domain